MIAKKGRGAVISFRSLIEVDAAFRAKIALMDMNKTATFVKAAQEWLLDRAD